MYNLECSVKMAPMHRIINKQNIHSIELYLLHYFMHAVVDLHVSGVLSMYRVLAAC